MEDVRSSSPSVITYRRRIDRTPEKDHDHRAENSKKLISEARRSVEGVRSKFTRLQDDVDERDKTIETERELRIAAEERLQAQFVDMYNSSEVNEELRERLPRANKEDPPRSSLDERGNTPVEELMDREQDVQQHSAATAGDRSKTPERSKTPDITRLADIEDQILPDIDNSENKKDDKDVNKVNDFKPNNITTNPARPNLLSSNGQYNPYMGLPAPPVYQSPYMSPYLSPWQPSNLFATPRLAGAVNRAPMQPSGLTALHLYGQTPSLASGNFQRTTLPTVTIDDVDRPLNVNDLQSCPRSEGNSGSRTNNNISDTQSSNSTIGGSQQFLHGLNSFSSPIRSSTFLPQHSPMMQSRIPESSLPQYNPVSASASHMMMSSESDQSKQIALLLAEVDTVKAINKKLTDKLCNTEQELVTLKGQVKSLEVDKSVNTGAEKAASLVQEVHHAQRKRDESMMGRVQLANDEKDELLHRLREVEQKLEDQGFSEARSDDDFEEDLDASVENLLSRVYQAETLGDMEQEYTTLAQRLEAIKQRQREINAEEMQDILEQRDLARAKAKKIEEELLRLQRSEALNNVGPRMQEKLSILTQERDMAVTQVRQLKEEIQKIQIIYSLHKSLSQESILRDQVNNTLATYESRLKQEAGHVDTAYKENNTLVAQIQELETDLQKKEAQIEKYEKLVGILRRKLKSQHSNQEEEH